MRELKFRLISFDKEIVGYEKWSPCVDKSWIYSTDNNRWFYTQIEHQFKDQFTGLTDKNGVEIYKDDIIKVTRFEESWVGIVTWDDTEIVGFRTPYKKNGLEYQPYLCGWYEYEVLGNIHQNPELLGES